MTKTCNARSCRTSRIWGADHERSSSYLVVLLFLWTS